jgi:hypothetical protein
VLQRLRQFARRWPGPCLVLVLLASTSQSLATTFDWCLHGAEGAHVASGLAPCDLQGEAAVHFAPGAAPEAAREPASATGDEPRAAASAAMPCHGAHAGAATQPMHHVAATSDVAAAPASAMAALPPLAHWQFLPWVPAVEFSGDPDAAPSRRGSRSDASRPTLSDAVPGESFRLLI